MRAYFDSAPGTAALHAAVTALTVQFLQPSLICRGLCVLSTSLPRTARCYYGACHHGATQPRVLSWMRTRTPRPRCAHRGVCRHTTCDACVSGPREGLGCGD